MSPPSVRTQLGGSGAKKRWWSRLIPDALEVRVRREFVLRTWIATAAGLLMSKAWPVLKNLWTDGTPLREVLSVVTIGQLVFALGLAYWYAAYSEGKGEHTGPAAKARLERFKKGGAITYFAAGAGLIDLIDKLMQGGGPPPPPTGLGP